MNDANDGACRACFGEGSIQCCDPYVGWHDDAASVTCGRCDTDGIADCLICRGTGRAR